MPPVRTIPIGIRQGLPAPRSGRSSRRSAAISRVRRIPSPALCSGLRELQDELIGVTLDRGVEHLGRTRVVLVAQDVALADQLEAGGLYFLLDGVLVDP